MKKILSIFPALLLIIFLISCGNEQNKGYKEYENTAYEFTISYPEDWVYKEGFGKDSKYGNGSIVVLQVPNQGKRDLFRENIHIFTESLPDSVKNIDEYFSYSKSYLPAQLEDLEFLEEGKININGAASRWIIFKYVSRLQIVNSIGYIFYRDGYGLVVTGTARPEDFMGYRRTFENIATSIKFK